MLAFSHKSYIFMSHIEWWIQIQCWIHIYFWTDFFVFIANVCFSDLTPNMLILCQLGVSVMYFCVQGLKFLLARRQTLRFCPRESGCWAMESWDWRREFTRVLWKRYSLTVMFTWWLKLKESVNSTQPAWAQSNSVLVWQRLMMTWTNDCTIDALCVLQTGYSDLMQSHLMNNSLRNETLVIIYSSSCHCMEKSCFKSSLFLRFGLLGYVNNTTMC